MLSVNQISDAFSLHTRDELPGMGDGRASHPRTLSFGRSIRLMSQEDRNIWSVVDFVACHSPVDNAVVEKHVGPV